ncbi:MAG: SPOR domain-containing protein [Almyronema sp.]
MTYPDAASFYRHPLPNLVSNAAIFFCQPYQRTTAKRWLILLLATIGQLGIAALAAQALPATSTGQRLAQALPPLPGATVQPRSYSSGTAIAATRRYMVYVNGNSPLLLEQVQQIEPSAFRRQYNGRTVIQTGAFDYPQNAQAQVEALADWGIGAEVAEVERPPIATTPLAAPPPAFVSNSNESIPLPVVAIPDSSVEFGQSPLPPPPGGASTVGFTSAAASSRGYYVVVPTAADQLAVTTAGISQLGLSSTQVAARTSPRGPHVAVGPFSDRTVAQQWNHYLRSYGYNARVHFDR